MRSDVWSYGCVIYEMTALEMPFQADNMEKLFEKVLKGLNKRIPKIYSEELWSVIRSMIQVKV